MQTFDKRTIDGTGAFLVGELERLDQRLHEPLAAFTWTRDIDLRSDVSMADESSSFTNSDFAAVGGINAAGKAWVGKRSNTIPAAEVDISKTVNPLSLWAMELGWTIPELESSIKVGRPIDEQKYRSMQMKYNMDMDEMVYVGDAVLGVTGLVNNAGVTPANASGVWSSASADDKLNDINDLVHSAWKASGFSVCPDTVLIAPEQYGSLTVPVTTAGSESILSYVANKALSNQVNGRPLRILPCKWLAGAGAGGADRMIAYTKREDFVRFPLVPLQRTRVEYRGLYQITTYYGRAGVVEVVYPETLAYMDGI